MEQLTSPETTEETNDRSKNDEWNKNEVYILPIFPLRMVVVVMYICLLRKIRPDCFQSHWELPENLIFTFCMSIETDTPIRDSSTGSSVSLAVPTLPKTKISDSENQVSSIRSYSSTSSRG